MDPLHILPDVPLIDDGVMSARFQCRGIETFRAACLWVRDVPYGPNNGCYPDAIFEQNRGTCRSKHGLIALLAAELGLPVSQFVGAYRLDESVIAGVGPVLAAYGLSYVPQLHCVLKYGEQFLDLTRGNCHGKRRDLTDLDLYIRATPFASDAEDRVLYRLAIQYYQRTDPVLARLSDAEIRRIARACSAHARIVCAA